MPYWPRWNRRRHWIRYRRVRGGSMPSSRSWDESSEKSASQLGNLEAWELSPRPISVRKVGTSGQKGMGDGISGGGAVRVEEEDLLVAWATGRRFAGDWNRAKAERRSCGLKMGCSGCQWDGPARLLLRCNSRDGHLGEHTLRLPIAMVGVQNWIGERQRSGLLMPE